MPPSTSLTYTYTTQADVELLLCSDGLEARLDDDASGSNSAAELAYLTKAIQWATARCNYYLLSKYPASDLADSWIVNQWCTIIAAVMVSSRRGNPSAASLRILYDEAIEDLKSVQRGDVPLPDVALRTAAWPAWSAVRVEVLYGLRKLRVERPLSETRSGRPDYEQHVDIGAERIREVNG